MRADGSGLTVERDLAAAVAAIVEGRAAVAASRSLLAALSGIDGSGKGFVASLLGRSLGQRGLRVALLNVDGWLNLPEKRFSRANPAEHFYLHALRFDDMFDQLVLPLREDRSVRVEADFAEETAARYRRHLYEFRDIDVILLEGIYLLKRQYRRHYDLSFWIDCSFETALQRAVARAQEGLPPEQTVNAYRTIYFPAQEIHFSRDEPHRAASATIDNDSDLVCDLDAGFRV